MILLKKAVRAIWSNKRAYLSCIVLMMLAVFMFTAMGGASRALSDGAKNYYRSNRLADVFAKVAAMPVADVSNLEEIEGISEVLPRLTYEARVIMPENSKVIHLRLISFDTSYAGTPLNAANYQGDGLTNAYDIMVGQGFLDVHRLAAGDTLSMIVEGKEVSFNIASGAIGPEYVYAVRNIKEMIPDPETFNIAYISLEDMRVLTGHLSTFNDISFALESGYVFDDVKNKLEETLSPYGLTELVAQKDQVSANMLNTEITQVKSMSTAIPVMFAGMAAIVLYLMLKRVIEQERTQIGTLKAFGYTKNEILFHYLCYGLFVSVVGGCLGVLFGNTSVGALVDMYSQYFTIPNVATVTPVDLALKGMLMTVFFGVFGAYAGAKSALSLNPADAMRPPSPPPIKVDIIQKLPFLMYILSSRGNMAVRNMTRAKVRSAFIVLSITFSFGMLAYIASVTDMVDVMLFTRFTRVQVYDAKLSLNVPIGKLDAEAQVQKIDGVYLAEAILEIPAEFRKNNRKTGGMLVGLPQNAALYHLYDDYNKTTTELPAKGLVLNQSVADKLDAKIGDVIYVKSMYNEDEIDMLIENIVGQNMSSNGFMEIDTLNDMLHLPGVANAVMVDTHDLEFLKAAAIEAKNVASTEETQSTLTNFKNMMNSYDSMFAIMFLIAGVIAFAIIYNTSTISLSEKKREYATLRVLGLQVNEVAEILSFEYWILFTVGTLLGVPFTYLLKTVINNSIDIDSFSYPTQTSFAAYMIAFFGCMAAVFFSNMSARRNIKKFDMVEVLKERE